MIPGGDYSMTGESTFINGNSYSWRFPTNDFSNQVIEFELVLDHPDGMCLTQIYVNDWVVLDELALQNHGIWFDNTCDPNTNECNPKILKLSRTSGPVLNMVKIIALSSLV